MKFLLQIEGVWVSGGTAPLILYPVTRWMCAVSFTLRPLTLQVNSEYKDECVSEPFWLLQGMEPRFSGFPSRSLVGRPILTEVSRFRRGDCMELIFKEVISKI